MDKNSKSIWTVRQTGLQACINWLFMVGMAAILFGGVVAIFEYFYAEWLMYVGNQHLPLAIQRIPAVMALVVATETAVGFILAVTVAFFVYCLARKLFGGRNIDEQRVPCEDLSKLPQ